ncbi:MAG: amidohydrolase family protein [Promethearchaeia archaeon]
MKKIIIKNGIVFDPINGIAGETKDILIESGKIVDKFSDESDIKEIDAKGKTVIPAGLDVHAHIASQEINYVRLLGSNNPNFKKYWDNLIFTQITKNYISKGYTFFLEANVLPSIAKSTLFNFQQIPILDKAMLINISNYWPLELEFQRIDFETLSIFLKDLLNKVKGFGLKIYNPFEADYDWNFKNFREDIKTGGRLYNFTALDVYETIIKANEKLGLPHPAHIHIEGYESENAKRNLSLVLERIKDINIEKSYNRDSIIHLAHASAYNIDGDNSNIVDLANNSKLIELDLGFIGFNEINPLISHDRQIIKNIKENIKDNSLRKTIKFSSEFEGDTFAALRKIEKSNRIHCIMWANAINLALKIKNKWQMQLTVNFPNYGNINDIPEIAALLMNLEARKQFISDMSDDFPKDQFLNDNNEILDFNEFVIISRSSPAKSLGLEKIKGQLGVGADGDINILNFNINEINLEKEINLLKNALDDVEIVIKAGEIVKNKENFALDKNGKIFWSEGSSEIPKNEDIISKKKEFYQKFYSIFYDSLKFDISEKLLRKIS